MTRCGCTRETTADVHSVHGGHNVGLRDKVSAEDLHDPSILSRDQRVRRFVYDGQTEDGVYLLHEEVTDTERENDRLRERNAVLARQVDMLLRRGVG